MSPRDAIATTDYTQRRKRGLGKLTPIEYETTVKSQVALPA